MPVAQVRPFPCILRTAQDDDSGSLNPISAPMYVEYPSRAVEVSALARRHRRHGHVEFGGEGRQFLPEFDRDWNTGARAHFLATPLGFAREQDFLEAGRRLGGFHEPGE